MFFSDALGKANLMIFYHRALFSSYQVLNGFEWQRICCIQTVYTNGCRSTTTPHGFSVSKILHHSLLQTPPKNLLSEFLLASTSITAPLLQALLLSVPMLSPSCICRSAHFPVHTSIFNQKWLPYMQHGIYRSSCAINVERKGNKMIIIPIFKELFHSKMVF